MTEYLGTAPFANLTVAQQKAIDEAVRIAPGDERESIWRGVRSALDGNGPWTNGQIYSALEGVLSSLGYSPFDPRLQYLMADGLPALAGGAGVSLSGFIHRMAAYALVRGSGGLRGVAIIPNAKMSASMAGVGSMTINV